MPTAVSNDNIKPYVLFGLDTSPPKGDEVNSDCPFCGRTGKFFINTNTGVWRCVVCSTGSSKGGGNIYTFIRKLHEMAQCPENEAKELAADRKLMKWETLRDWGCVLSPITNEWLVPGHAPDGKLNQLYRYTEIEGKMRLPACAGLPHQLHGVHLFDKSKPHVFLCEGPWDAMALWEALGMAKDSDGLKLTSNTEVSLRMTSNVLAAPGATTFPEAWSLLFADKDVSLMYDSDHPLINKMTKKENEPTGYAGMRRVCGVLSRANVLPKSVMYLHWGDKGYDPNLKDGYDVRDHIGKPTQGMRVKALESLLSLRKMVPGEWITPDGKTKDGSVDIQPLKCETWMECINEWKKAMKWTEGLDRALSIMLACVVSTTMPDDQLWIKVMSPPSTGKTSLCEGLAIARKHCRAVENFTGLHSGFQTDFAGEEDNSLLIQLKNMTFIIKEADPILRAPNRDKVLAQLRSAYDTNCAVAYGNKVKREYKNHRFTVIMCGTESLLELDSSELGARFLDVVIMTGIDEQLESDINNRIFYRVFRNRGVEANGVAESHNDQAMLQAKRVTGGYVEYLRTNSAKLLGNVKDENAAELVDQFDGLAQFVAFMRARPSKKQDEITAREMSGRLNCQFSKLAICLAAVMNRPTIDDEVMRRVCRTVLDTARGKTYDICKHLVASGQNGLENRQVVGYTGHTDVSVRELLRFLAKLGVVESYVEGNNKLARPKWRMTPRLERLWRMAHA